MAKSRGNKSISRRAPGWNRKPKNYSDHYFTTSVSGGYSLFTNTSRDMTLVGGGGGTFALGYEFRNPGSHIWFSLAAEFQGITSSIRMGYPIYDRWINDSEGRLAMYHYDMIDGRDAQMAMAGSVPFMIGYLTNSFYIGIGPKVGYYFWGQANSSLEYKTHATYDRYIDEYEDMPNHYYTHGYSTGKSSMNFNTLSVALCFEAGYDVLHHVRSRRAFYQGKSRMMDDVYILKLGFYAEYGFLDVNGNEPSGTAYAYNETNPYKLIVKPFYTTETPTDMALRPFYAGIKLTFMVTTICGRCRGKAKVF